MMQDINKNILVTASSHGLGYAIAKEFSQNGYGVIIHGRNADNINQAKEDLDNVICTVQGDLRDEGTIDRLVEASGLHNISVLVNNAAIPCYGVPLAEMAQEQIMNSLQTNLVTPIILTNRLYSTIIKNAPGAVININSIVGIEPKILRSVHSATKWGLRGFSKSLRLEASDAEIKVINVYPSRVMTTPEFEYGLEPSYVATRIYEELENYSCGGELLLDGRPEKFKPKEKYYV
jgi:short-subunit dehydrogenase